MIELNNITKLYTPGDEEIRALDGVSLRINKGEFVAIIGASGSGKSTLMQILGLMDKPSSGAYRLFGRDVAQLDEATLATLRNRHFGFVFQQFFLLPKMTALENTALPQTYAGDKASPAHAAAQLERLGLTSRAHHRPNEMSGGQQQRVAIARALVNDPEIILADEPTGNLDSHNKIEVMKELQAMSHSGKTVILITHEPDMAQYAQRIITMKDGRIISDEQKSTPKPNTNTQATETAPLKINPPVKIREHLRQAIFSIASHKTRSLLSILGIMIGVAAVVAMLSLGAGAQGAMNKQLAFLGSNLLIIRPGAFTMGAVVQQTGSSTRLSPADTQAIVQQVGGLRGASGSVNGRAQVIAGGKNWNTLVEGCDPSYEIIRNATPIAGRFFSQAEAQTGAKVALLGLTVVRQIFGDEDPLGQTIRLNSVYFTVIGVLPARGTGGMRDQDDVVIIPLKTAMHRLLDKDYLDAIYVDIDDPSLVDQKQAEVIGLLERRYRVRENNQPFDVRNMADVKNTLGAMTRTMSSLLGVVATISLVVGGIGIMNIMLVAVVERRKEIGLRKAVGATQRDILHQFLLESIALTLLGGLLGVVLGAGASALMAAVLGWAVSISLFSIVLSTGFSCAIGLIFGLWPAMKAAKLNPIEALRYD